MAETSGDSDKVTRLDCSPIWKGKEIDIRITGDIAILRNGVLFKRMRVLAHAAWRCINITNL